MSHRGAYGAKGKRPAPKTPGERMRAIRLHFGWTQGNLARLLDVGQQAVSNWEQDRAMPVGAVKQRLSRLLGVDWEAIETGVKFRVPDEPPGSTLVGEGILAIDESNKRPVLLPTAAEGEAWMVVVGTDERTPLDVKRLPREIREALKDGGAVWVVVKRPEAKPDAPASKSPKKSMPTPKVRKPTRKP